MLLDSHMFFCRCERCSSELLKKRIFSEKVTQEKESTKGTDLSIEVNQPSLLDAFECTCGGAMFTVLGSFTSIEEPKAFPYIADGTLSSVSSSDDEAPCLPKGDSSFSQHCMSSMPVELLGIKESSLSDDCDELIKTFVPLEKGPLCCAVCHRCLFKDESEQKAFRDYQMSIRCEVERITGELNEQKEENASKIIQQVEDIIKSMEREHSIEVPHILPFNDEKKQLEGQLEKSAQKSLVVPKFHKMNAFYREVKKLFFSMLAYDPSRLEQRYAVGTELGEAIQYGYDFLPSSEIADFYTELSQLATRLQKQQDALKFMKIALHSLSICEDASSPSLVGLRRFIEAQTSKGDAEC
eukprot:MONOS_3250.1-p1 / transcript=MONOS_3250.1 / gene=MONOS_3250 / organism=Monocercomonoides_exilis_PA203 / gene_product=unspecified product / transcript_product=unspecified product / location=Mono_scaffold00075:54996-56446(+) / protein_length=354 / sequence_SO=supercontig / SO=protein_coding / is_pseudo=false